MEQAYEYLENGQWTEARRYFEMEVLVHPKNLEARYNLALLLQQAGHPDEELELYQKNMTYGWHLPTIVNLAAIYTANGSTAKAKELLKQAAKHFRHEATPRYLLAEIEEKNGHLQQASEWHDKALHADPLNGFAHIRYAHFLAQQKKFEPALKHALKAIRLQPTSSTCLTVLGDIQTATKDYSSALESYQKSLAIKPDPETRQRLIDVLHQLGKHERAERMQQALDAWLKHRSS